MALSRDHPQGPGQDPSGGGVGGLGGASTHHRISFLVRKVSAYNKPQRGDLPTPSSPALASGGVGSFGGWGGTAVLSSHSQKWRHLAPCRGCLRGWLRRKQCPPPSPVSDGLGKECVGSDLERESETRRKPGCGAGDGWGGGLGGLDWSSAKARATTI